MEDNKGSHHRVEKLRHKIDITPVWLSRSLRQTWFKSSSKQYLNVSFTYLREVWLCLATEEENDVGKKKKCLDPNQWTWNDYVRVWFQFPPNPNPGHIQQMASNFNNVSVLHVRPHGLFSYREVLMQHWHSLFNTVAELWSLADLQRIDIKHDFVLFFFHCF